MDIKVGVIGSTGLVGNEIIKCLEELKNNKLKIFCYASSKSSGEIIQTDRNIYKVEELKDDIFSYLDYAIFVSSSEISKEYAKIAARSGCIVIDNSSFFRMDEDVPLVCIGSNDEEMYKHKGIIANPNCSTIQLMRSLRIIDGLFGVKKVIVSTYQSVSGIGKKAVEEYTLNSLIALPSYNVFPFINSKKHYSIKDNVIPQIDEFDLESGYTKEELKMTNETKKILGKHIDVVSTCVRVPTYRGHAESVSVETNNKVNIDLFKEVLETDDYIELKDDINNQKYPLVNECYYSKKAQIGRIRKDLFSDKCLHYFIVGDNLYLGAAYNAVMILKGLIEGELNDEVC